MKKTTLIVLWIAVSLMFFGGILAVSTYAISGGNIGVYYQNGTFHSAKNANSSSNGKNTTQTVEFSDIHSLAISSDVGNVKVISGETGGKFIVSYSHPVNHSTVSCSADGGTIRFKSIYDKLYNSSFNLFGSIPAKNDDYNVTITYPQGTTFNSVSISSNFGNISLEEVVADKVDIESDIGQVYCDGIATKNFSSSAEAGNTLIENSQLGKTEIEASLGEITTNNITTSSLDVSCEAGNVEISGALNGKTEIENSLGNISVKSSLPRTAYNLDLMVELGSVKLEGKHEGNSLRENNNAVNAMQLQCAAGSISLDLGVA